MKKIVIIGGRGNGTVVASIIEDCIDAGQKYKILGFLNDNEKEDINNYPIIGGIQNEDWKKFDDDVFFIYTLSTVKVAFQRHNLLRSLKIPNDRFASVIHPTATVSKTAELGFGNVLMPYSQLGANAVIGDHTTLMSYSYVGHDDTVGEFCFISAFASTGGRCIIEDGVHLGHKSSMLARLKIGKYSVVGLAAAVTKDVDPFHIVAGVPAKKIGEIKID